MVRRSSDHAGASWTRPELCDDVVLVAAGDTPILLLRALHNATGKSLRELTELIEMTPVAICEALPHHDPEALVARIANGVDGAVLEVPQR